MRGSLVRLTAGLFALYVASGFATSRITWLPGAEDHLPAQVLLPGGEVVVRGAASIHTELSHDAVGSATDVALAARAAGLHFVLIGDHPSPREAWVPATYADSVLLVFGEEVALDSVGRMLVFGLSTPLVTGAWEPQELLTRIEAEGATTVAVHGRSPRERERWELDARYRPHGWEVIDLSEAGRRAWSSPWGFYHVTSLLAGWIGARPAESLLRMDRLGFGAPAVAAFDTLAAAGPMTALAGLNHHPQFTYRGRARPGYHPFFETFVNHLILDADLPDIAEDALEAVAEAIRGGAIFLSHSGARYADRFRMAMVDEADRIVPMGGEAVLRPGLQLRTSEIAHPRYRVLFRLVRDGRVESAYRASALALDVSDAGVYRVEAYRYSWRIGSLYINLRPWIFANPVRVVYGVDDDDIDEA